MSTSTLRRVAALASLALIAPISVGIALADTLDTDGDNLVSNGQGDIDMGNICVGASKTSTAFLQIRRSSSGDAFASNATVDLSVVNITGDTTVSAAKPPAISLPSTWATVNSGLSTISEADVTVSAGSTAASNQVATINYKATGAKNGGGTATSTDGLKVKWSVVSCAPVDTTAPVVTPTVSGTLGNNGWYTSNVVVSWTVSDPESAVTSSPCGPTTISADTGGTTVTCSATSTGGTNSQSVTIKRDATPPTITAAVSPDAVGDWYNGTTGAPTVSYTCNDGGSGIASCTGNNTFGEGTRQAHDGTATDNAGNSANTGVNGINVDTIAPTITASLDKTPVGDWYNGTTGAPTVSYTCNDGGSGIASCTGNNTFGEGTRQAHDGTATDNAGNSANTGVNGINVDTIAPTITASLDKTPVGDWYNGTTGAPTVSYTCNDGGSGIASCTGNNTFGQGAGQSHTGTATDAAGNTNTASVNGINVDTIAPTITASLASLTHSLPGSSGWWNIDTGVPTVSYTCNDGGSGIASCTGNNTFGEGTGQSHTGTATDTAGNSASTSVNDVKVDTIAPAISWNGGISGGESFYFGGVPAAPTCSATDVDGSGVNGGCSVTGYSAAVGPHTLIAAASDVAGNRTSESRGYRVMEWTISGFSNPVDMNGVWNTVKNGSTVPLKFRVFAGSTELTQTTAVAGFTVKGVACPANGAPFDDIEMTSTGGTSLRYDATGAQFIQNWQTPKKLGACYEVKMTTVDGSSITANFKLK